jgi:hypothetical protein
MNDFAWAGKMLDLGGLGIACFLMWKLFDKWAGLFLGAQRDQTKAMTEQAAREIDPAWKGYPERP